MFTNDQDVEASYSGCDTTCIGSVELGRMYAGGPC